MFVFLELPAPASDIDRSCAGPKLGDQCVDVQYAPALKSEGK